MQYRINVHANVSKFLSTLDLETKNRIIEALRKLETNPLNNDVKKLKGTKGKQDLYRLRIGSYRVIFAIEDNNVYVLDLISRERGYKWL